MSRDEQVLVVVISVTELLFYSLFYINLISTAPCKFEQVEPKLDHQHVTNVASEDMAALAAFKGYLKYPPESSENRTDSSYITLEHISTGLDDSASRLSLGSKCASIILKTFDRDNGYTEIVGFFLLLEHPTRDMSACATNSPGIIYRTNRHYRCSKPIALNCYETHVRPSPRIMVVLRLNFLEFEINGDQRDVREGKYTRQAQDC